MAAGVALAPVLAMAAPPTVYTTGFHSARAGYAFSQTISTSVAATSYGASGLPPGLSVNASTGTVSGTPTAAGTYPITLSATNAEGTGTAAVSMTVEPGPTAPPVINLPDVVSTERPIPPSYYWYTPILATNFPTRYTITGLPAGAQQSSGLGDTILWLSPAAGIYSVTISVTNPVGTTTKTVRFEIVPRAMTRRLDKNVLNAGETLRVFITFDAAVAVTGQPRAQLFMGGSYAGPTYQYARYVSGSGTPELTFEYATAPTDFTIDAWVSSVELNGGTITHAGTGLVVKTITPPVEKYDTSYYFRIHAPPRITSPTTASATAGTPFSYTIVAANRPTGYAARNLPAGLTVNASTGVIAGAPTTAGTYNITLEATNTYVSTPGTATLQLTVSPVATTPPPPPPASPPPAPPPPATPPPAAPPPAAPPAPTPTPVPTQAAQTIAFTPPGTLTIGQPVTITANASSGLPVTLTVVSGSATLNGSQLTVNNTEPVIVRAVQAGNASFAAATADLTVSAARGAQSIEFVSPVSNIIIGQPVQLSATASSGLPINYSVVSGNATISGNLLTVTGPGPVVVRAIQPGSSTLNAASAEVTITGAVRPTQAVAFAMAATEVISDTPLTLAATSSSGLPVTFEVVSGPATLNGNILTPTAATGTVTIRALQRGSETIEAAETTRTLTIAAASRLINLSSRVTVREGDASRSLIAGFVVSGTAPKRMLVRAVGPALTNFGVQSAVSNPRLRVFDSSARIVAENDDWSGSELASAFARLGAFGLTAGSRDAALLVALPPGAYTLHLEAGAGEGVGLAEIYDASDVPAIESQQMVNLSTRAFVGTGESVLTAGFVVTGSVPQRVLIRGIGPALGAFGVAGTVADPVLTVHRGEAVVAQNDDWQTNASAGVEISTAAAAAGAFALPAGSKDAALILTLAPGAYTATVSGAGGVTGAGLVEVYRLAAPQ